MDYSIFQDKDVTFEQRRVFRIASISTKRVMGVVPAKVNFTEAMRVDFFIRGRLVATRYMRLTESGNPSNKLVDPQNSGFRKWYDSKLEALRHNVTDMKHKQALEISDAEETVEKISTLEHEIAVVLKEEIHKEEAAEAAKEGA